jgi:undecaprenyl-diphosphatase
MFARHLQTTRSTLRRLGRDRSLFRPLLAGLLISLLAWIFVVISGEMVAGATQGLDQAVLGAAQSARASRPWIASLMRDLSGLGSTVVLTLCTAATVGYLALLKARRAALLVAAAAGTGSIAVVLLKAVFGRLRPDAAWAELVAQGPSFPSGHAGNAAIVFLTLGAVLAASRTRQAERSYILAVAALLTLLVGVSRIVLGVHWASDVLAGWAFGAAWALLWLLPAQRGSRSASGAAEGASAPCRGAADRRSCRTDRPAGREPTP